MAEIKKTIQFGGKPLTISTGKLASQATSAVMAQHGETVVFATVVRGNVKDDLDYFPLSVDYMERLYAGGRIKGSRWVKREGKASDEEILSGRLIDRSIRPLFPSSYRREVQVIVNVMSIDMENDPVILGSIAVSAALAASSIPWEGPIATLRIGRKDEKFIVNPTTLEISESEMDLVVSSTADSVVMIEAGMNEIEEDVVAKAISFAKDESESLIKLINEFAKEVGHTKEEIVKAKEDKAVLGQIKKILEPQLKQIVANLALHEGGDTSTAELIQGICEQLSDVDPKVVTSTFEELIHEKVREMVLSGERPDGRKHDQLRQLTAEVGLLPRTHGTGLFQRGQTQVLSVATLGASSLGQLIETAEGEQEKRYIHHYSMPPYATGEAGRFGGPNRREIGHGALAERAIMPVIPSEADFPYAIRIVSEVMSSNGSTSMASTCGSTLALMDAGVPIKAPVGGIAMGVIVESPKEYSILTDIVGFEDHHGDMDFKVAGTTKGITALQLDVKTLMLTDKILGEALVQAHKARIEILKVITDCISAPREKVSVHAPKIETITIPTESIGEIIGPGGRTIKKLTADTGAQIEVEDTGVISISSVNAEAVEKAKSIIAGMTRVPQPNELYDGTVTRVENYGAFVEIFPGKEGLVHVSDMDPTGAFVSDANEKAAVGDKVNVRVVRVDEMGRLKLSMNMDPASDQKPEREGGGRGGFGGGNRGGSDRRGGFGGGNRGGSDRRGPGIDTRDRGNGPHFPTSRLMDSSGTDKRPSNNRGGRFDR